MSSLERVIRHLEDYILEQNDLHGVARIPFVHHGRTEYGYPYIRLENTVFETALLACAELLSPRDCTIRFLEIGCGLGTKCGIARSHGMQATGIDLKAEYVDVARSIYLDCTFVRANALEFDYGAYDLAFYHVPFFDDSLLFELETRILSQLPIGGVLFVSRFSETLQEAIYDARGIKDRYRSLLCDPRIDTGRIRILQKRAPLDSAQLSRI